MHGRVKVRTTAEQEELKRVERAKIVEQYRNGMSYALEMRKKTVWQEQILRVTEQMVLKNPDIYTLWNIRREAFDKFQWSQAVRRVELENELVLTENCLRANRKSYSVWHQRCWVINQLPEPDWETELSLCAKCLDLDERNFHCWDYRQYIVKKAGVSEANEFDFSTTKIQNNFSNYSSWHYRSLILPKMFPDETGELPIKLDKHKEELDLVMNATFTDPNDTSAWFYQRWLLDRRQTSPQSFWRVRVTALSAIAIFNKEVSVDSTNLSLSVDGNQVDTKWETCDNNKFGKLWLAKFADDWNSLNKDSVIEMSYEGNVHKFHRSAEDGSWLCRSEIPSSQQHNMLQLMEQLDNYKQLAEMEPNNKWAILTGLFLMKNIDPVKFHATILEDLSALSKIDKLRSNFYSDLRSKYLIDYALRNIWKEESVGNMCTKVDLSNLGLTIFYNEQYFGLFDEVNLGANHLENSLHRLYALQECRKLSLSSNNIKSLKKLPALRNLRVLSLRNNRLTSLEEILDLVRSHDLVKLDLRDNPLCESDDIASQISNVFPDLDVQIK